MWAMTPSFDDLSDLYDAMIDWDKRLAHETPFYREVFDRVGARRILDVACGTGRHAALFHSWGLEVEGADISPAMLERARQRVPSAPAQGDRGLRWVQRGFDQPVDRPGSFDVAICVGNSLALAPTLATVDDAVEQMLHAVRPGGAVVIHVLNAAQLPDGPCVWQKARRATINDQDVLIIKGVHRTGERAFVELIVSTLDGRPQLRSESVPFLALRGGDLEQAARGGGAASVHLVGGYRGEPFVVEKSVDLILVAQKAG